MTSEQKITHLKLQAYQGNWTNPTIRILKRLLWDLTKPHTHHKCWVCGRRAQVRHHIRPLSRGGWVWWPNVIEACNHCHSLIHPWLARG